MNKDLNQKSVHALQAELREVLHRHNFSCMNVIVFSNNSSALLKIYQRYIPVVDKERCDQVDKLIGAIITKVQGGIAEDGKGTGFNA